MRTGNDLEREASYFAACILIPKHLIVEDLRQGIDLSDDKALDKLCKKYGVTQATMTLRLSVLNHKPKRK